MAVEVSSGIAAPNKTEEIKEPGKAASEIEGKSTQSNFRNQGQHFQGVGNNALRPKESNIWDYKSP